MIDMLNDHRCAAAALLGSDYAPSLTRKAKHLLRQLVNDLGPISDWKLDVLDHLLEDAGLLTAEY